MSVLLDTKVVDTGVGGKVHLRLRKRRFSNTHFLSATMIWLGASPPDKLGRILKGDEMLVKKSFKDFGESDADEIRGRLAKLHTPFRP